MSARPFYLLLAVVLLALNLRAVHGQDGSGNQPKKETKAEEKTEKPSEPAKSPAKIDETLSQQGKSPLFYMMTRDGQLVLASNIKYEDIQEYFDLKQKMRQQSAVPNYAVTRTDIRGTVTGRVADLTVRVDFEVTTDATDPISVPLNLGGLVRPQFNYRGDGSSLSFSMETRSFVGSRRKLGRNTASRSRRLAQSRRTTTPVVWPYRSLTRRREFSWTSPWPKPNSP